MRQHGCCSEGESDSTLPLDRLAGLCKIISPEVIEQALSESGRTGQRTCTLSHRTMLWVVLAMGLLTHLSLRQVYKHARRMVGGQKTPGRSSLCEARQRLGWNLFVACSRGWCDRWPSRRPRELFTRDCV
jgi:hypothetical protein